MADEKGKGFGVWAFIIGVILALVVGIAAAFMQLDSSLGMICAIMAILGLIVGILNVTDREVNSFIIAAIGLTSGSIAIAGLGPLLPGAIGKAVTTMFTIFGVFVAGAVFIPALKSVYKISHD